MLQPDGAETQKQGLIGVDHVAYTYASLEDLFENYVHLKSKGILPYWCVHHGMTISMYYADLDGNQMEFQVDVFDSAEAGNVFMCSPANTDNPVGVEYDSEDWLAQVRASQAREDRPL